MVALAVIVAVAPLAGSRDDRSFDAGYAAVSDPSYIRSVLSEGRMTSAALCDDALNRAITSGQSIGLRRSAFLRGCKHAVGDAME